MICIVVKITLLRTPCILPLRCMILFFLRPLHSFLLRYVPQYATHLQNFGCARVLSFSNSTARPVIDLFHSFLLDHHIVPWIEILANKYYLSLLTFALPTTTGSGQRLFLPHDKSISCFSFVGCNINFHTNEYLGRFPASALGATTVCDISWSIITTLPGLGSTSIVSFVGGSRNLVGAPKVSASHSSFRYTRQLTNLGFPF